MSPYALPNSGFHAEFHAANSLWKTRSKANNGQGNWGTNQRKTFFSLYPFCTLEFFKYVYIYFCLDRDRMRERRQQRGREEGKPSQTF